MKLVYKRKLLIRLQIWKNNFILLKFEKIIFIKKIIITRI